MNKLVLPVVFVGAAAIAAGGIKYTGDQAHASVVQVVEQINTAPQYEGMMKAELQSSPGYMASSYQIDLIFEDPNIVEVLQIERIPFVMNTKNGFLTANYDLRLAPGELLDALKATQANPSQPPVLLLADASFNPVSQELVVDQIFKSDTFAVKEENNEFRIGAFESEGTIVGNEMSGTGSIGDTVIIENGEQLVKMSGMTLAHRATLVPGSSYFDGLLSSFKMDATIGEMWVNNHAANKVVTLNDIGIAMAQAEKADRTLLDFVYSMGAVAVESDYEEPVNLNSAKLDMTFDFDKEAFQTFSKQVNELPQAQRQNPFVMMGLFSGLTNKGINLNLSTFDVQTDKGILKADGDMQMAGFDMMQGMQNPNALLQKLDGNFQFSVDESLLQALPDQNPYRELDGLAAQGLMKKEGGKISTEVSVNKGKIVVNGIPMT
ncbi:DUF945 family protein [Pontibacterium granulatum]|uniref:DUF945 family protein n=1 Tax=Pontibacterium granulatum TaxID=2036029 RepID=UPI00249C17EB|nr:DUF945 family protein [Pontibacterium granulatum]MDI3325636.1 DUF945 family protein [Pontibacterium granulatum]